MSDFGSMQDAAENGSRLDQLHELLRRIAWAIDSCGEAGTAEKLPALSRQYRETLREIHEIEGDGDNDDAIARIASRREADGKPGAVR